MNGKWYLFTDSRGSKMTIDGINSNDIYIEKQEFSQAPIRYDEDEKRFLNA